MAEKDGKKRKRQSNGAESSSKKVAFGGEKGNIKVDYHDGNGLHPALVSAPGLTPPSIAFNPYAKPTSGKKSDASPKPKTHDFLLQSSQHPRLDYTATPSSLDQHQSHYIAVYDPATNQLQITPAHYVSLRSIPRKISDESKAKGRSLAQQREALGQEFGTKKAKKVIASRTENAITKGNQSGAQSGAQNAVLENMADAEAEAPGKEQVEQDQLASKPIPRPNLSAESVEQVYTFSTLIPQGEARLVPVKDWQERA
ncbi:hypothetical protein KC336_g9013, partial [Hortaea werneckii]